MNWLKRVVLQEPKRGVGWLFLMMATLWAYVGGIRPLTGAEQIFIELNVVGCLLLMPAYLLPRTLQSLRIGLRIIALFCVMLSLASLVVLFLQ